MVNLCYSLDLDVECLPSTISWLLTSAFPRVRRHEAGPANYKTGNEYELLSESPSRRDITFGTAARESMGLM
ncbi:unnamed protein product, partial [Ectocarpus sp. 12 AP-2014]